VSRIPAETVESAPPAVRPLLEELAKRSFAVRGGLMNLHAEMAHTPSILAGYMGLRRSLEQFGTLDHKTRVAIMLVSSSEPYTVAVNTLLAAGAGWSADEVAAIRTGNLRDDQRLSALLAVAQAAAESRGNVGDRAWQRAREVGWTAEQLGEVFAIGAVTDYVDRFVSYSQTELDVRPGPDERHAH
jgi:alkylhydroperoxidase family enzyme